MLSVLKFEESSQELWNETYTNTIQTTYYSSLEWAQTWETITNRQYKAQAFYIMFSDHTVAIFPTLNTRVLKGFSNSYISSIYGTYVSLLSNQNINNEHYQALLFFLSKKWSNYQIYWSPFLSITKKQNSAYCHVVDLQVLDLKKLYSSATRRCIKKSEQAEVYIIKATKLTEWESFYDIYFQRTQEWDKVQGILHSKNIIKSIFKNNSNAELWLAKKDNEIIAGNICFKGKGIYTLWIGACKSIAFKYRPNHALYHHIFTYAQQNNFQFVDFSGSMNLKSVEHFKEGFGAKKIPYTILEKRSLPLKLAFNIKNQLSEF